MIRLIFAQAGVEYEDIRFTKEQWAEFKPKTPYGVMPVIDIDGQLLGGSLPIARYLAKQYGLAGEDDIARLILEGAEDTICDFKGKLTAMFFEKDEEKKAALKKELGETHIPRYFGALEKLAAANTSNGWFHGPKVSYVDFFFHQILSYLQSYAPNVLDDFPALKKLNKSVVELTKVAKWIKERPDTPY